MLTRLHTLSTAASNTWGPIPPHSQRRTTKKIANNTTTTSTTRKATRANGICHYSLLPWLPKPHLDRLQGDSYRGPRVGDGPHQVYLGLVLTLGIEKP